MDLSNLFDSVRNIYANYAFNQKSGMVKMPLRYILELTYRCNLKCPFCYITGSRQTDELSTNEWIDIIRQIPPFSLISFVAGEVILKEDFDVIFKAACEKYRKTTLITNGLNLNDELINLFVKHNLLLLSVSLDAIGEKHDLIRNHKGLYDKVLYNLDLFNAKRRNKSKPMLDIKTCILENNLDELVPLYKQAIKLNAQFFSLTFIRNHSLRQNSVLFDDFTEDFYMTKYPVELYFDITHFKEVYKELESLSKKSKTILRYAPRFNPQGDWDKIEKFFSNPNAPMKDLYKKCSIPMTSVYITPKGDIYPCLSYKIANLKEKTLKEAINVPKFKCFRKNLYHSQVFNACQMCCDLIPKNQ
ncbi:radical SAM protein [bacterium]|nr:radical SAM protein [bacterium]